MNGVFGWDDLMCAAQGWDEHSWWERVLAPPNPAGPGHYVRSVQDGGTGQNWLDLVRAFLRGEELTACTDPENVALQALARLDTQGKRDALALEAVCTGQLCAVVLMRKGQEAKSLALWERVVARCAGWGVPLNDRPLLLEHCAVLMGKGLYRTALEELVALGALQPSRRPTRYAWDAGADAGAWKSGCADESGLYWSVRAHAIAGICHQSLGEFSAARLAVLRQERLLRDAPLLHLQLMVQRRKLSLAIEEENAPQARRLLSLSMPRVAAWAGPTLQALFSLEQVHLGVLVGDHGLIREAEETLRRLTVTEALPSAYLNAMESRVEKVLIDEPADQVLEQAHSELTQARSDGQLNAEAVALLFLARAELKAGLLDDSARSIESALSLAEQLQLGRHHVRTLLFKAAIAFARTEFSLGLQAARLALVRARQMGLQHQIACAVLLAEVCSQAKKNAGELWVSTLPLLFEHYEKTGSFEELKAYLRTCGLEGMGQLCVQVVSEASSGAKAPQSRSAASRTHLLDLIALAKKQGLVVWWKGQGLLSYPSGKTHRVHTVGSIRGVDRVCSALLDAAGAPLSLQKVFAIIEPRLGFVPHRHGARVYQMISRVRASLSAMPLHVETVKPVKADGGAVSPGAYRLVSERGWVVVTATRSSPSVSLKGKRGRPSTALLRQQHVLALLAEKGPLSLSQIGPGLQIRRQSVHPILRQLEADGLVTCSRRGRSSAWQVKQGE